MTLLIFFFLSLLNVMLQTIKSILTMKGGRAVASIINAVAFGFYVVVMKQLANFDMFTTVTITIVTNLIGVYVSILILEKFKKDSLWKITATSKNENETEVIKIRLNYHDISFTQLLTNDKKTVFDIYSKTQSESDTIKSILNDTKSLYHYTVVGLF